MKNIIVVQAREERAKLEAAAEEQRKQAAAKEAAEKAERDRLQAEEAARQAAAAAAPPPSAPSASPGGAASGSGKGQLRAAASALALEKELRDRLEAAEAEVKVGDQPFSALFYGNSEEVWHVGGGRGPPAFFDCQDPRHKFSCHSRILLCRLYQGKVCSRQWKIVTYLAVLSSPLVLW